MRLNKDFEAKYIKVKAKLAFLNSGTSSKSSMVKNKGLVAKTYEWDEEGVPSDDNDMTEVKVLMALVDDENVVVGKKSAGNGKWVKISMRKVHTLLDMEDNDEQTSFLDYLCIDLNYVEEQRNNLVLKHRDLVQELNTCKEQLLVLKQAKLNFLTMQHVNIEILKENKNLRKELKELTTITETWLNSSNKVNQCIIEQIPSQKKRILGLDQLTKDPSSFGQTNLVFVKFSDEDTKVSISGVERPWLSEAEGFTLPNHDTGRILPTESQVKITDPLVSITDSSATEYDSANESSICSTLLPPLEKLDGVEPISGPKTIKSILKSNSTIKPETLKGVTINKPSSAPAKDKKNVSGSKRNSAPTGKLKNVKIKDNIPLSIVMKELNDLKVQISKNRVISLRIGIKPRNPQQVTKSCETCGSTIHTITDHNDIEYFRRGEALQAKKAEAFQSKKSEITGVKSYLHKYVEQPGPKVVFGDNSTCITEGYGSIKCNDSPIYIYNHKDHLGKFDKKADDGYLLGYSLVSKAFRVFNTRRQQTKETYHVTFDESPKAIKFSKPLVDNINIAKNERYLPDEYLHPYEPSQRYQANSNDISFIEPYESPEPVVLETEVSSDQNGQTDQNDHNDQNDLSVQNDEILNDDHSKLSNHTNDEQIIDNLPNTKDIQISEHSSFLRIEKSKRGISINQEKYVKDLLKKYEINGSSVKTLMVPPNNLGPDLSGKSINKTHYRGVKLVCWSAKKQQSVAMSSAEAENVAAAGCCVNILWMKSQLTDYDIIYEKDHILKGDIDLHFIPTQYQLVDIFTKTLDQPTFKRLIVELGMLNIDSKPEASALPKEN
ncbi:hypothetical protein Tco_0918081 [Tanacetum coccineum]